MKYPYLMVALIVFFGVVDIIILGNQFDLTKSDWSGWVQAIGSIAALGVAIFVMSRQNKHAISLALSSDKRALVRRGASVNCLIDRAQLHIGSCLDTLQAVFSSGPNASIDELRRVSRIKFDEANRMLAAVPGHELGSYEMTQALQNMIECLGDVDLLLHTGTPAEVNANRQQYIDLLKKLLENATVYSTAFKTGLSTLETS